MGKKITHEEYVEKFEFYHEYLEIGIRIKSTTRLNLEENFELKLNQWHNLEEGKKIKGKLEERKSRREKEKRDILSL